MIPLVMYLRLIVTRYVIQIPYTSFYYVISHSLRDYLVDVGFIRPVNFFN